MPLKSSGSLELVTIEHSDNKTLLRKKAELVSFPLSAEIKNLVAKMKEKVLELEGLGLAAPQVGYSLNLFVYVIAEEAKAFRKDAHETIPVTVLFNASYEPIGNLNEKKIADWEGCFSVTSTMGKVPRYRRIKYHAQDEFGQNINGIAKGFTARVLQHEIDHLRGILIIDRLNKQDLQGPINTMRKIKLQEFMAKKNN